MCLEEEQIFSYFDWIINIIKLIEKYIVLLKSLNIVPEPKFLEKDKL